MKKYLILSLLIFSTQTYAGFGLQCQNIRSMETVTIYVIEDGNLAYIKKDSNHKGPLKEITFEKITKIATSDFKYTYKYGQFAPYTLTVSRNGDYISSASEYTNNVYDKNCKVLKGASYDKLLKRVKANEAKKNNKHQNDLNQRKL